MCGILGSVNIDFEPSLLSTIAHRGPDSKGVNRCRVNDNQVIFAQTRLAILDLSETGNQPMESHCCNYMITFNGEIYNHLELRERLPEISFKGHSDTETILYYLIKFGEKGISDLNGIFAFAFLDKNKKRIILARDPFGVKPLYFYHARNEFFFSSEIRTINKIKKGHIDLDNLATLLKLRYIPSPDVIYNKIKKIIPGHHITIDISNESLTFNTFCYLSKIPETINIQFNDAIRKYEELINNAVHRQLQSDVEVGIFLSGGIDSAIIAHLAQKYSSNVLKAFTVGFEGAYNEDEIIKAKKTADNIGLDHHPVTINFDNFLSVLKEIIRIVEEPLATTSSIPMYFLAEKASKYVKVVLAGQGADEPLGGYQKYQGELISQRIPSSIIKLIAGVTRNLNIKDEKILRALYSLGEKDDVNRFLRIYSIFSDNDIKKLISKNENRAYDKINYMYTALGCYKKKRGVEKLMAIDSRLSLPDDLLLYTDKITMNFGLECRVPMLDLELVNFIESLPLRYRLRLGQGKIIHKRYANKILPQEIINRKKLGFQSPTRTWFNQYEEKIKDLLLNNNHAFSSIFNLKEVENIINKHNSGYNMEKQIFLLLSIHSWMELTESDSLN
jgi:asparagine synthase (glutamine-hydrolysing)